MRVEEGEGALLEPEVLTVRGHHLHLPAARDEPPPQRQRAQQAAQQRRRPWGRRGRRSALGRVPASGPCGQLRRLHGSRRRQLHVQRQRAIEAHAAGGLGGGPAHQLAQGLRGLLGRRRRGRAAPALLQVLLRGAARKVVEEGAAVRPATAIATLRLAVSCARHRLLRQQRPQQRVPFQLHAGGQVALEQDEVEGPAPGVAEQQQPLQQEDNVRESRRQHQQRLARAQPQVRGRAEEGADHGRHVRHHRGHVQAGCRELRGWQQC
mmetsp:Transcript_102815/g.286271  ORF Transcript_102815/g.286271 Transcript_102815/m.286271 type:complete len:265 (-) Transcript_102815:517-1311(-)